MAENKISKEVIPKLIVPPKYSLQQLELFYLRQLLPILQTSA